MRAGRTASQVILEAFKAGTTPTATRWSGSAIRTADLTGLARPTRVRAAASIDPDTGRVAAGSPNHVHHIDIDACSGGDSNVACDPHICRRMRPPAATYGKRKRPPAAPVEDVMRAEIDIVGEVKQSVVRAAEEASLTSTRHAPGWPRTEHREAEDPNLWSDQQRASARDAERTCSKASSPPSAASSRTSTISPAVVENRRSREARREGRCRGRGAQRLKTGVARARTEKRCSRARPMQTAAMWRSMPAPAAFQDWANMLLRMYTRWAEQHGFKVGIWKRPKARRPASSRRPSRSRATAMAGSRPRTACTGWCASRRSVEYPAAYVVCEREGYPVIDDRIVVDIGIGCAHPYAALERGRGPACPATRPNRRSASPISRPTSWSIAERRSRRNRAQAWQMLRARLYELD